MHQPQEGGRDCGGRGVGVAEVRRPANAHQQQRQDRGGSHHQHHQPLAEQAAEERFLQPKVCHQHVQEIFPTAGEHGGHRKQQVKRQAGQGVPRELQRQALSEQLHAGRPEQRDTKERQESHHAPVVCDAHRVHEHGPAQPSGLVVDPVLEQTSDDEGEQQHVEHLAGAGCGVLPETKLQPAHHRREKRGHPVAPQAQQRVGALFTLPLLLCAVMREKRHRAHEHRQCQRPEHCGEDVHRRWHHRGRQHPQRQREQIQQRSLGLRQVVPPPDIRHGGQARKTDPRVQRGEVQHQRTQGDGPGKAGYGE